MKFIGKSVSVMVALGLAACGGGHAEDRANPATKSSNQAANQAPNRAARTVNAGTAQAGWWDPGDWGKQVSGTVDHVVQTLGNEIAKMDPVQGAKAFANKQAADYHDSHGSSGSFADCVVIVAAACAAAGSAVGAGPWGAALGGGAGAALADLSCRAWYP